MIYREEVLTVMGILGDIRADLREILRAIEDDDGEETEADS